MADTNGAEPDDDGVIEDIGAAGLPARIARVCVRFGAEKDPCNWRSFGDPDAVCPEHRRGQFQRNKPYLGQPTRQYGE